MLKIKIKVCRDLHTESYQIKPVPHDVTSCKSRLPKWVIFLIPDLKWIIRDFNFNPSPALDCHLAPFWATGVVLEPSPIFLNYFPWKLNRLFPNEDRTFKILKGRVIKSGAQYCKAKPSRTSGRQTKLPRNSFRTIHKYTNPAKIWIYIATEITQQDTKSN